MKAIRSYPALLCLSVLLPIEPMALGASGLASDDLFDPEAVHKIRLSVHPSDWQKLKADFRSNDYYPCAFEWRGISIDAGIRSAGLGTRNEVKPALRVDFNRYDEGQKFLGLKSVRLKNLVYDASMVKERIVMSFYRRMGLSAPRTAHARLYINGEYAGLYLIVESVDKPFLRRNFEDDTGYLYKYEYAGPYRFEYLGANPSKYVPLPFEPHTHELDPKPGGLVAMVRDASEAPDSGFDRTLSKHLDLRLFLGQLAVEMFFAEADGLVAHHGMANFYLYQSADSGAFRFVPWDKDRTFFDTGDSIWRGTKDNVLTRRALEVPALRQAYLEAFWQSAALAGGAGGWLEREIKRASGQVREAVREDPVKRCPNPYWEVPRPCSIQDFEEEVVRIGEFARVRGDEVKRQLAEASFEPQARAPVLLQMGPVTEDSQAVLVPGSLITAFGQRFADVESVAAAGSPLPTTLGGASVLVNGIPAPLLLVSPLQVNLQVPWEIETGTAPITVVSKGLPSRTIQASVGRAAPTLFAVVHQDGAAVSVERPAKPGDTLLVYATGLGPVSGVTITGDRAPSTPLLATSETATVKIGDLAAEVLFSGLAPGLVGVFQVNLVVPAGIAADPATLLTLTIAGQTSGAIALPTRGH